jgi:tRNA (guanine26-N2/guanine27-N2)-dimethyltransferase
METIKEGLAEIKISSEKKISKKLEVFYNPVMKLNRDVSVLLLNSIDKKDMQFADPLAGTGIRGIRFLKELEKGKIKNLSFNDNSSAGFIKENLKLNKIDSENVFVFSEDANKFMYESKGFDYIDIDPFGSPNPFLETAIVRLARDGILAVTATDTSALSGSSETACKRKYWAKPLKNEFMHENGLRILIRRVQLTGADHDKALTPIFSYSKDHYYRIFFRCEKGKKKVDELLKNHKYIIYNWKTTERKIVGSIFNNEKDCDYAGPLWTGDLWDEKLIRTMVKKCDKEDKKLFSLISLISEESKIHTIGFYDLNKLANVKKKPIPKTEDIIKEGKITRTHFLGWGVRTKENLKL